MGGTVVRAGIARAIETGSKAKARQMRLTAVWLIPVAWAIERVDQWVAFVGVSSRVFVTTRSTSSSEIERGLSGRGSSCRPSRGRSAKRRRHLPTVVGWQPSRAAIPPLASPLAAASTIRQRRARACALFGRLAHRSSVSRSSALSATSDVGRPRRAILASHRRNLTTGVRDPKHFICELTTQDTSRRTVRKTLPASGAGATAPAPHARSVVPRAREPHTSRTTHLGAPALLLLQH